MEKNINEENRSKTIVRTSIIGIAANVFLAGFKAAVGFLSNSIAVTMDAVNNLSGAMSSLITIIGTKLSNKPADRKHPFGYGRIEYLSALVISLIVTYAGITSLIESIKKIFDPAVPDYSNVTLILLVAGIAVKLLLGRYVKSVGKRMDSDPLINSGEDALMDSIISLSTLIAALIYLFSANSLEAYLGTAISLLIIKTGIGMIGDTVSRILGEPGDHELASGIRAAVLSFKEVKGVYDMVMQDYGPDAYTASLHIEVEDSLDIDELDRLTRDITGKVYQEHHVLLTAIGIYSIDTKNKEAIEIRKKVRDIALAEEGVEQMHGFHIDLKKKEMDFDIVVSLDAKDRDRIYEDVVAKVKEAFPDHKVSVALDTDFIKAL